MGGSQSKVGVNPWTWDKPGHEPTVGILRFTGEDPLDFCERWAEKPKLQDRDRYEVPYKGFDLTCDMFPEDLTIPARTLGEEPRCVSSSFDITELKGTKDWTLTPVVKFCNMDVCSDLTIIAARKQCREMLPKCFGVDGDKDTRIRLDYTSGYKFWMAPAGYLHQIMNETLSSLEDGSAITTGPKCFGKDITDGKMPEDKTPIEGKTWMQMIKDRLPENVFWTERTAQ